MSVTDIAASAALISGASLSMLAGIAVLRFPDVMSRIHAATKPQVLGIMLMMLGVGLRIGTPAVIGVLVLIVVLQFVTAPISAHLVVRAAYRRRGSDKPDGTVGPADTVGLAASELDEPAIGRKLVLPGEGPDIRTNAKAESKKSNSKITKAKPTAAKSGTASVSTGYGPTVADSEIELPDAAGKLGDRGFGIPPTNTDA